MSKEKIKNPKKRICSICYTTVTYRTCSNKWCKHPKCINCKCAIKDSLTKNNKPTPKPTKKSKKRTVKK